MNIFIINPKAGGSKGTEIVKQFVEGRDINYRTYYTEYAGHAESLAEQLANLHNDSINMLIVVGGDGTMYEVINGLKDYPEIPIAFIPVGSGNDFARGCKISLKPSQALKQSLDTFSLKPYWAGKYITNFKNERHVSLFASSLGFGFDAEVAKLVNESRFKSWFNRYHLKILIYIFGLIRTIFRFNPKSIELEVDGKTRQLKNIWMLTLNNHPYFGGGMKIAPSAEINRHTFEVTVVHNISKLKLLLLFLTVFWGKHTRLKEVETFKASHLSIKSKEKLIFHADGSTDECYRCEVTKDHHERMVKRK